MIQFKFFPSTGLCGQIFADRDADLAETISAYLRSQSFDASGLSGLGYPREKVLFFQNDALPKQITL
jgi:hypothetical protein